MFNQFCLDERNWRVLKLLIQFLPLGWSIQSELLIMFIASIDETWLLNGLVPTSHLFSFPIGNKWSTFNIVSYLSFSSFHWINKASVTSRSSFAQADQECSLVLCQESSNDPKHSILYWFWDIQFNSFVVHIISNPWVYYSTIPCLLSLGVPRVVNKE